MSIIENQKRLIALGFGVGPKGADGKSGAAYTSAVKAFQVASGLTADGKVGRLTDTVLFPKSEPPRFADDLSTFPPSHLQPGPAPATRFPLQRDCMGFYGGVGLHQTSLVLPFAMRLAWDKGVTVRKITVHEKVHDSAARAFDRIAAAYDEAARKKLGLDLFGGSLNVRKMRGGSSYSMHSWGIAIDFDPERNQLAWGRDKARLAQPDAAEFWRIWEAEGWVSLGRSKNMDWMHVQAARLA